MWANLGPKLDQFSPVFISPVSEIDKKKLLTQLPGILTTILRRLDDLLIYTLLDVFASIITYLHQVKSSNKWQIISNDDHVRVQSCLALSDNNIFTESIAI